MNLKSTFGKWLAGALLVSASVGAQASTYTITIAGVNPFTPPDTSGAYAPTVLPGMFVGLGNCDPAPGADNSCIGGAQAELNLLGNPVDVAAKNVDASTNFTDAIIYGYGLPVDQVIFHAFSTTVDVAGGAIITAPDLHQTFDFLVGSTGAGSAGLDPDAGFDYLLNFARMVTISGGTLVNPTSQIINQAAVLHVANSEDTLNILDSEVITFDLGTDGTLSLRLLAVGPITQGDPGTDVVLGANAVPLPSSLALAVLGLACLARRRRQAA